MFKRDQQVTVVECPEFPTWVGRQVTLVRKETSTEPSFTFDNAYHKENAYWLVQNNDTLEFAEAWVEHIVKPGERVIVDRAPIGWRELEGTLQTLAEITKNFNYSVTTQPMALIAPIIDFTPLNPAARVEPVTADVVSKSQIAQAVVDSLGDKFHQQPEVLKDVLNSLEVSFTETHVKADTAFMIVAHEVFNYPQGVELYDWATVSEQLASKFKAMSTDDLTAYLFKYLEQVDAKS